MRNHPLQRRFARDFSGVYAGYFLCFRRSDAICKEMKWKLRRRRSTVLGTVVNRAIIIDTDARWHAATARQSVTLGKTIDNCERPPVARSGVVVRRASAALNRRATPPRVWSVCDPKRYVLKRFSLSKQQALYCFRQPKNVQKLHKYHCKTSKNVL